MFYLLGKFYGPAPAIELRRQFGYIGFYSIVDFFLPERCCVSTDVGRTFSLADNDTKNANGINQRQIVKKASTCKCSIF